MSNHARGLWGYTGAVASGSELTIQATGMGGPSAAIVLGDLIGLGVRRAVRIGTCVALGPPRHLGELLLVAEAQARGGSGASFGVSPGDAVHPDASLTKELERELAGEASTASVASFDAIPTPGRADVTGPAAADMQTVAVLALAQSLGVAAAAILVVAEAGNGARLPDSELENASKRAGAAAKAILSG